MVLSSSDNDGQVGNAMLPSGGYWCKKKVTGSIMMSQYQNAAPEGSIAFPVWPSLPEWDTTSELIPPETFK